MRGIAGQLQSCTRVVKECVCGGVMSGYPKPKTQEIPSLLQGGYTMKAFNNDDPTCNYCVLCESQKHNSHRL